ncbi:MerR family transcriptional regulator [Clostridium felsineum]|uniref:HTH-type transcriptional regulator n=1 Tax=Clostridium felsineum TaxID=36839 RepID=A0A1S8L4D6_9CLOT|nr:MerR family transcriptional regulator [Clostridium felsineum]URZ06865.1 putative HTH-type transcriptional regulator [Clostridium felsineum]URZ11897.1 putative HTH-type transcriptional regulator [Clostridium felsineum]
MYTLKQICEITTLSEHTVRYYTDQGLVPSVKRDSNNRRVFDEKSIDWLTGIKRLKACGMSIKDLKTYVHLCLIGDATVEERYNIILNQKKAIDQKKAEIIQCSDFIDHKLKHYKAIKDRKIEDDTNPDKWDKKRANDELYTLS